MRADRGRHDEGDEGREAKTEHDILILKLEGNSFDLWTIDGASMRFLYSSQRADYCVVAMKISAVECLEPQPVSNLCEYRWPV